MPIFEIKQNKILFIHIPKTGGSSIKDWLASQTLMYLYNENPNHHRLLRTSPQHLSIRTIKELFGESIWSWSFAIIRNPYEKMESEFFYRCRQPNDYQYFSQWLIEYLNQYQDDPFILDNHLRPQNYFVDKSVMLFKFEHSIEVVVNEISRKFNLPVPSNLSQNRVEAAPRKTVIWTQEARKLFNAQYALDFEFFDYEMVK
jgi:hypothetical protein